MRSRQPTLPPLAQFGRPVRCSGRLLWVRERQFSACSSYVAIGGFRQFASLATQANCERCAHCRGTATIELVDARDKSQCQPPKRDKNGEEGEVAPWANHPP